MTWQERAALVLLVAGLALTARLYDLPARCRRWYWQRRRSWHRAPPSPYGAFTPSEWASYRRKNPRAWE